MPDFIMTVGLPACGKTAWAKKQKCVVVSSDDIRADLFGDASVQGDPNKVFDVMRKRTVKLLRDGKSVVYDATNLSGKKRRHAVEWARAVDGVTTRCVVFVTPIEVCKARNAARDRSVPDSVYNKMLRSYNVPQYFEGWDQIEIVWDAAPGEWEYPPNLGAQCLMNFDQCNSHHDMTLGEHMKKAETYLYDMANATDDHAKQGELYYLAAIAGYHDIGKYYTQSFTDTKGNPSTDAHYYGHENYGAYIMLLTFLESFENRPGDGRNLSGVALDSAGLINWHMRPYVWEKSEKARERDREYIGEEMYQHLLLINEADKAAHKEDYQW